jgi:hypothetical protein
MLFAMSAKLQIAAIAMSLSFGFVGCAPRESFSWIDRHCFVADWTNHHSCVSCCHGNCKQAHPMVEYPMLVLGNQPAAEAPLK